MSLSNNEPTLTAFVSKESDEKNTYKSGDKVKCNYGEGTVTGELRNGWSIYNSNGSKYADLYKDRLQSKNITITPYEPTQTSNSMEPTLTAFVSRGSDEQKTYKSGDTVKINYGYGPEVIGELRNGWSIYSNGSNIADLDNKAVLSKELTMTPDTSPTVYNSGPHDKFFSTFANYGGKRSRRRKSRKSRRSRKYR